jgi:cobalt-zinc-cadmium efflux system protein
VPTSGSAFALGIVLNLGFVIAEVVYGLSANSLALLSDAGHNLSDVLALALAWGAARLTAMAPTRRRTYGWGRSSILAALINSTVLLVVVGGISWEAAQRFFHPEAVAGNTVMVVAAAGIVINLGTALLFLRGRHDDLNVRSAFQHMAGDAAIAFGVVVAGLVMRATGWVWLDPLVSLVIGLLIVAGTLGLLREAVNLSMDAVPESIDPASVEAYLAALPGVNAVHDLHIWAMSTTDIAMTVHLVMTEPPGDDEFLHLLGEELHERFGIDHTTTQFERGAPCSQAPAHVV